MSFVSSENSDFDWVYYFLLLKMHSMVVMALVLYYYIFSSLLLLLTLYHIYLGIVVSIWWRGICHQFLVFFMFFKHYPSFAHYCPVKWFYSEIFFILTTLYVIFHRHSLYSFLIHWYGQSETLFIRSITIVVQAIGGKYEQCPSGH